MMSTMLPLPDIPTKAGIQCSGPASFAVAPARTAVQWAPAFTGLTERRWARLAG
jgi:hypothetical protein